MPYLLRPEDISYLFTVLFVEYKVDKEPRRTHYCFTNPSNRGKRHCGSECEKIIQFKFWVAIKLKIYIVVFWIDTLRSDVAGTPIMVRQTVS